MVPILVVDRGQIIEHTDAFDRPEEIQVLHRQVFPLARGGADLAAEGREGLYNARVLGHSLAVGNRIAHRVARQAMAHRQTEQADAGHGVRVTLGQTAAEEITVIPGAVRVLAGDVTLGDQVERADHRHIVSSRRPQGENRVLRI